MNERVVACVCLGASCWDTVCGQILLRLRGISKTWCSIQSYWLDSISSITRDCPKYEMHVECEMRKEVRREKKKEQKSMCWPPLCASSDGVRASDSEACVKGQGKPFKPIPTWMHFIPNETGYIPSPSTFHSFESSFPDSGDVLRMTGSARLLPAGNCAQFSHFQWEKAQTISLLHFFSQVQDVLKFCDKAQCISVTFH